MNRDREKTGYTDTLAHAVLSSLAIISVVVVLCGATMAASGVSWRAKAYLSVVSVLFDLIFVYEFLLKAIKAHRQAPTSGWSCPVWLLFASSIPPFLLVSGPFLAGWLQADFASAAVRGYGIATPPLGALATVSALRLLRLARPFIPARAIHRNKPAATAAGFALSVVFLGAILVDSFFLPSWSAAWTAEHESTLRVFSELEPPIAQLMVTANPNIQGAVLRGLTLKTANPGLMPTDYIALSNGNSTLWFDARQAHSARGMAELLAALAICVAAIAYGIGLRRYHSTNDGCADSPDPDQVIRTRATPVCAEELEGILGKSRR